MDVLLYSSLLFDLFSTNCVATALLLWHCVEPESLKFLLPHTQKISSLKRLGCKAVSSLMHIFIVMKLGSSLLEGSKRIYGQGLGQDK